MALAKGYLYLLTAVGNSGLRYHGYEVGQNGGRSKEIVFYKKIAHFTLKYPTEDAECHKVM